MSETASLLSNPEIMRLGDIITEADNIDDFRAKHSRESFLTDTMAVYAVQKPLQNLSEACIQIEGKKTSGRFGKLFPEHDLTIVREIGNLLRHDYGGFSYDRVWEECDMIVPSLRDRAQGLLDQAAKLHGK